MVMAFNRVSPFTLTVTFVILLCYVSSYGVYTQTAPPSVYLIDGWINTTDLTNSIYPASGPGGMNGTFGKRMNYAKYVMEDGTVYVFGGMQTTNAAQNTGHKADLWMYNITNRLWKFLGGQTGTDQYGVYSRSDGNSIYKNSIGLPGSRYGAAMWVVGNTIYLFGGRGKGNSNWGALNDMWLYHIRNNTWTYFDGHHECCSITWTRGESHQGIAPSARWHPNTWIGPDGLFYLYGGYGYDHNQNGEGSLGDMWAFNTTSMSWKRLITVALNTAPVTSPANPNSRYISQVWPDNKNKVVYIYGGYGYGYSIGWGALIGDMYMYNYTDNKWKYVMGSNQGNQYVPVQYPVWIGDYQFGSGPGNRAEAGTWIDANQNLWLYGGTGYDENSNLGPMSDTWMYNTTANAWKWMGGNRVRWTNPYVLPTTNFGWPGCKTQPLVLPDKYGQVYLFGGYDGNNAIYRNDLWLMKGTCSGSNNICKNGMCVESVYTYSCINITCTNGLFGTQNLSCIACNSGFYGKECTRNISSTCTPVQPTMVQTVAGARIIQSESGYVNNTLIVKFKAPYVNTRKYTSVSMTGATDLLCDILGNMEGKSYWSKGVDGCEDSFTLLMPWGSKTRCGFAQYNGDPAYLSFSGQIIMQMQETIGNFSGQPALRNSQEVFDLFMEFPKMLTLYFNEMNVTSEIPFNVGLTGEKYDSTLRTLTLEFSTVVTWSYMVAEKFLILTKPSGVQVIGEMMIDNAACTQTAGSTCLQKHTFKIKLDDVNSCSFDGDYTFNSTIKQCRNPAINCTTSPIGVSFTLAGGNVCGSMQLRPSITGKLKAYPTNNFNGATQDAFNLGDLIYFYANLEGTNGNDVAIVFSEIMYNDNAGSGNVFLLNNGTASASATAAALTVVNNGRYFSLTFNGALFTQPLGGGSYYTFTATIVMTFGGNRKRTVMSWDVSEENSQVVTASSKIRLFTNELLSTHSYNNDDVNPRPPTPATHSNKHTDAGAGTHTIVVQENPWQGILIGMLVGTIITLFVTTLFNRNNMKGNVVVGANVANNKSYMDLMNMLQTEHALRAQIDHTFLALLAAKNENQ